MKKFTIGLVVANYCGVLNRITGLYGKRGYNINSLHVEESEDKNFSRMLIVSTGDEYAKGQMTKQLQKLHDVKKLKVFDKVYVTLEDLRADQGE